MGLLQHASQVIPPGRVFLQPSRANKFLQTSSFCATEAEAVKVSSSRVSPSTTQGNLVCDGTFVALRPSIGPNNFIGSKAENGSSEVLIRLPVSRRCSCCLVEQPEYRFFIVPVDVWLSSLDIRCTGLVWANAMMHRPCMGQRYDAKTQERPFSIRDVISRKVSEAPPPMNGSVSYWQNLFPVEAMLNH